MIDIYIAYLKYRIGSPIKFAIQSFHKSNPPFDLRLYYTAPPFKREAQKSSSHELKVNATDDKNPRVSKKRADFSFIEYMLICGDRT